MQIPSRNDLEGWSRPDLRRLLKTLARRRGFLLGVAAVGPSAERHVRRTTLRMRKPALIEEILHPAEVAAEPPVPEPTHLDKLKQYNEKKQKEWNDV